MSLPKHIQRQLDEANALEAQIANQPEPASLSAQSVSALLEPVEVAPPVTVAPPPPAPAAPKDDFEHKYRVLQGMYEADVKRTQAAQRELDARLAAIEKAPAAPAAEPNAKDIETFGADLIAMVQRYAESNQAATEQRLGALEQRIGTVTAQTQGNATQMFFQELERRVPDYAKINADDRWLVWLGEKDGLFDLTRQAALEDAQSKGNVARVASFFLEFQKSLPAAPQPDLTSLSQQVVPSTTGSPAPARTTSKPTISEKAITSFYNDVARGKYDGREAERDSLELAINIAVAEGRVR